MDRFWLLTSTTYGNWLPGDPRGFVSTLHAPLGGKVIHNTPRTEYDRDNSRLREYSRNSLKVPPILLNLDQAKALHCQFHETATYRNWKVFAAAIMAAHFHLVVGVPGDPDPEKILGDFKAYGSRILNLNWQMPESETWWTESGSKRKLVGESAVQAGIEYVRNQENPLVVWIAGEDPAPDLACGGEEKTGGLILERRTGGLTPPRSPGGVPESSIDSANLS